MGAHTPITNRKKDFVTAVSGSTNDKGYGTVSFDAAGEDIIL